MTDHALIRPKVTLKLATSLDGRIATSTGQSKWITGPQSRTRVHEMRAAHDCVLTGIGTVLADDPELTARTQPPTKRQPLRAVLDSKAQTPSEAKLLNTSAIGPVCLFHDRAAPSKNINVKRIVVERAKDDSGLDLEAVLMVLFKACGVKTLMVEAGARLAGAFLRAGFVDELVWFRAPIIIGGDGLSVFSALGIKDLSQALSLECIGLDVCGNDAVETYRLNNAS